MWKNLYNTVVNLQKLPKIGTNSSSQSELELFPPSDWFGSIKFHICVLLRETNQEISSLSSS